MSKYFHTSWEELNQLEKDEFIDKSDYEDFQYYLNNDNIVLMEMANVMGNKVVVEHRLPFSFHFCDKNAIHGQHAIRVKILWNPSKAPNDADGYMELHGDYKYIIGSHKYKPTGKELQIAREFFKKYKVLFAAVWERVLYPDDVIDYFKGIMKWQDLMNSFYDIPENISSVLKKCRNLTDLEYAVRRNKAFNMND